ncbi:response regulator transcription factor [Smaragdicoccus niigatensis]|uniref:response regulator transcription factor n=1 Tax=Smaragdicoccus niigatensis TaxID=359359 RepID=UPI000373929D|nr:response regulator transcription factor [Smaragdicoccus niigatensis]
MIRVVLVDDQALIRSGFALILGVEDDIEVVGEAANGREAIDLTRNQRPDVVLMDVQMPILDGIAATREIVMSTEARVLILTTFDRDDYVFDGLAAGASGFLLKNSEADHLIHAVRTVAAGNALLAPEVTRRVISRMAAKQSAPQSDPRIETLTPRELEVVRLVGRGWSNAEIAAHLVLGEATVKTHLSNAFAKLHLRDRVQAVVFAYEAGLILAGEADLDGHG